MSKTDPAGLAGLDISKLSEDKLRAVATDLQQFCIASIEKDPRKHTKSSSRMAQETKPYGFARAGTSSSSNSHSNWILSENEYPAQDSRVIYFDGQKIRIETTSDLNNNPAIISKLPSRWRKRVYVYTDGPQSSLTNPCYRFTSGKGNDDSLRWLKTIYLEKLPKEVRFKVFVGNIKWLFIADDGSRSSTETSMNRT